MRQDLILYMIFEPIMESLEEKQTISLLLDMYGSLLTDRQNDFIDLHYNEDLSFGEIAESENISRQAVHDAILHGKKMLEKFEEHLGLVRLKNSGAAPSDGVDLDAVRKEIAEINHLLRDDILYDTGPLKRKFKNLMKMVGASE